MKEAKTAVRFAVFFCFLFLLIPLKAKAAEILTGGRLSGLNRYETSVSISNAGWDGGTGTAIITTGGDFPDALCAAPLAKKYNAPILLTSTKSLNGEVSNELTKLHVSKVYIVGGTGAVSTNVQNQLAAKGINCSRISGINRYETSIAVAKVVGTSGKLVVATGENYPDVLSIASWAASNGAPIILTESKTIPASTAEYLKSITGKVSTTYVIGGSGAVSDTVMSKLKSLYPQRIGGQNRYATNLKVLSTFKKYFNFGKLYIATGDQFPDALSGSALAAQSNSPIILSDSGPLPDTKNFIDSVSGSLNSAYVLGGTGAVSDSSVSNLVPPIMSKFQIAISPYMFVNKKVKAAANITMIPANTTKPTVTFAIEDSSVISMDGSGEVTALKLGETKFTASAAGRTTSIQITVRPITIVIDPGHGGWSTGTIAVDGTCEKVLNLEIADKLKAKLQDQGYDVVMTRDDDSYISLADRAKIANDIYSDLFISVHNNSSDSTVSGTETCYSMYRPDEDTSGVYAIAGSDGANVYNIDGTKIIGRLSAGKKATVIKEDDKGVYIYYDNTEGIVSIDDVWVGDSTPCDDAKRSKVLAQKIDDEVASLGQVGWERSIKDYNDYVTRYVNSTSVLVEAGFISNSSDYAKISDSTFQDKIAEKITDAVVWYFNNYNQIID